jgi:D-alanine-D-alanine ligase
LEGALYSGRINVKRDMKKIRVGIIFGGRSAEHEVSLQSAKNVFEALDKDKFEPVLIGISKEGRWCVGEASKQLLHSQNPRLLKLNEAGGEVALVTGGGGRRLISIGGTEMSGGIDVIFPVLHGTYGEDGTMQGLLKLLDIPFVGAGVLGSALGMDKDAQKRLLRDAGIPTADFIACAANAVPNYGQIRKKLGEILFVKPANLGSSVGIHKVKNKKEYITAVEDALRYDTKILIEEFIQGREIECSVLGNANPVASIPGEVIPQREFYSYEAKYIDENGAILEIPAKLPAKVIMRLQKMAVKAFKTLCLEGMARVDFFVTRGGKVIINELNTIPGFTNISMYPKLWEASGLGYSKLIEKLIKLAIERDGKEKKLITSYSADS